MTNLTPNIDSLDHATMRHLCAWLDYATDETDRGAVQNLIESGLGECPDGIDRGLTWREIAERGQ